MKNVKNLDKIIFTGVKKKSSTMKDGLNTKKEKKKELKILKKQKITYLTK